MRSVGTQLDMLLPDGADKTLVFRTLETLRMRANASVALADTPMFVGNDSDLEDFWG